MFRLARSSRRAELQARRPSLPAPGTSSACGGPSRAEAEPQRLRGGVLPLEVKRILHIVMDERGVLRLAWREAGFPGGVDGAAPGSGVGGQVQT